MIVDDGLMGFEIDDTHRSNDDALSSTSKMLSRARAADTLLVSGPKSNCCASNHSPTSVCSRKAQAANSGRCFACQSHVEGHDVRLPPVDALGLSTNPRCVAREKFHRGNITTIEPLINSSVTFIIVSDTFPHGLVSEISDVHFVY